MMISGASGVGGSWAGQSMLAEAVREESPVTPAGPHRPVLFDEVMLHLAPELVREDEIEDFHLDPKQFRRYLRGRMPRPPAGCTGAIGHPSAASAEKGEQIYHYVLDKIRTKIFLESEP